VLKLFFATFVIPLRTQLKLFLRAPFVSLVIGAGSYPRIGNARTRFLAGGPLKPGFGLSGDFGRIEKLFLYNNRKQHGTGTQAGV